MDKQKLINSLMNLYRASQRANMTYHEHLLCLDSQSLLLQHIEGTSVPATPQKETKEPNAA